MREKNKIAIYGCGGMGINICLDVLSIPSSATGFPDVEYTLIDTSESNLKAAAKDMNTYLIPGLDGSGKDRRFSHTQAEPHIDRILTKYQPKDFNVVIMSLGGGSGSTIGPLLIRELIARDEPTFVFCVGNADSAKEAENSLKTLATLQGISAKLKKPVVAKIYKNDHENPRPLVDRSIENDVRALALMLSGLNSELDNEDIQNFLYFHKVTPIPPQLVDMVVYSKGTESQDPDNFTAIAIASVLPSYEDLRLKLGNQYGCAGYMPLGIIEGSQEPFKPLHFILTNALMNERMEYYKTAVAEFEEAKEAINKTPVLTLDEESNEDGFHF